jgi:hypothetical protein
VINIVARESEREERKRIAQRGVVQADQIIGSFRV